MSIPKSAVAAFQKVKDLHMSMIGKYDHTEIVAAFVDTLLDLNEAEFDMALRLTKELWVSRRKEFLEFVAKEEAKNG